MNFDNKKIMPRFFVVIVLMSLGGLYILGNAAYLMFVESEYWTQVSRKLVKENVPIPAKRGNILSADGQIMASSLPEYKIYMDYVASDKNPETAKELQAWRDSVLIADLDSISQGLSKIFPDKTAGYFKKRLKKGKNVERRNWQIYGRRISYIQYKECKKLPLFRESPFKGGFYAEEFNQRKKPYGSLATRTLGALYASKDSARYGLELSYDSILRGKEGVSHRAKVRNKWLSLVDAPPVDGNDIETTIDVSMQDAACQLVVSEYRVRGGKHVQMSVGVDDAKQKPYAVLERLMAFADGGKCLDLTANVRQGTLTWDAPEGEWRLIAAFCGKTRQKVKRAAPGGEGYVLDHFSAHAVDGYLAQFDEAFAGTAFPHNVFNDSYEVYKADWTQGLFDKFYERRGYKLEEHLPEFLSEERTDATARIISDYRETLSDLLLENFTRRWTAWAHSHNSSTRNQAHGSPGNLIDLYAAVDVPECEGFGLTDFGIRGLRKDSLTRPNFSDISMLKYASSAAHLTGKPYTSSETFTWLTEHFRITSSAVTVRVFGWGRSYCSQIW